MTNRPSSFIAPHKGLRLLFADVLVLAGRTDPGDATVLSDLLAKVRVLFLLLELHADDENAVILARLDERLPDAGDHDRGDHERLEALQARLHKVIEAIERSPTAVHLDALYTGLQDLFAQHLLHMREEETVTQLRLWQMFSDAELSGMRATIMARLGPERSLLWLTWILPALRSEEARPLLNGVLAGPDDAFRERALSAVRKAVGPVRWAAMINTGDPVTGSTNGSSFSFNA